MKVGDQVFHTMTRTRAEVRRVSGRQLYLLFWLERKPVFVWFDKRHWRVVEE